MSAKWKVIGTNALEAYNPEYTIADPKEKAKAHYQRQHKAFEWGMKIERMKVNKAKRSYKKEDMEDAETI